MDLSENKKKVGQKSEGGKLQTPELAQTRCFPIALLMSSHRDKANGSDCLVQKGVFAKCKVYPLLELETVKSTLVTYERSLGFSY